MVSAQYSEPDALLTVPELARKLKIAPGTLYNHIAKWGPKQGVIRLGPQSTRIDWEVFRRQMLAGKITLSGDGK